MFVYQLMVLCVVMCCYLMWKEKNVVVFCGVCVLFCGFLLVVCQLDQCDFGWYVEVVWWFLVVSVVVCIQLYVVEVVQFVDYWLL